MRWPRSVAVTVFAGALAGSLSGCGGGHSTASPKADQSFLKSVYSGAPDISSYRTSKQLVNLGQVVCDDLESGNGPGSG